MIDPVRVIDLIEEKHRITPICDCGRHTTPIWRDGVVWLECSVVLEPATSRLRRVLAAVTSPPHVHDYIVDVPASDRSARAA